MDDVRRTRAESLKSLGVVTVVALLLAFAAFDDITTDNDSDFRLEYTFLAACAGWLCVVAFRLIRASYRVLGGMSLVALAGALGAQWQLRPGITPGLWPAYLVVVAAFLWFFVLSVVLLVAGWRVHPEGQTRRQ